MHIPLNKIFFAATMSRCQMTTCSIMSSGAASPNSWYSRVNDQVLKITFIFGTKRSMFSRSGLIALSTIRSFLSSCLLKFVTIIGGSPTIGFGKQFRQILKRCELVFLGNRSWQLAHVIDVPHSSSKLTFVCSCFLKLISNLRVPGHLFRFFMPHGRFGAISPAPIQIQDGLLFVIRMATLSHVLVALMWWSRSIRAYFRVAYACIPIRSILMRCWMYAFHVDPRGDGINGYDLRSSCSSSTYHQVNRSAFRSLFFCSVCQWNRGLDILMFSC